MCQQWTKGGGWNTSIQLEHDTKVEHIRRARKNVRSTANADDVCVCVVSNGNRFGRPGIDRLSLHVDMRCLSFVQCCRLNVLLVTCFSFINLIVYPILGHNIYRERAMHCLFNARALCRPITVDRCASISNMIITIIPKTFRATGQNATDNNKAQRAANISTTKIINLLIIPESLYPINRIALWTYIIYVCFIYHQYFYDCC